MNADNEFTLEGASRTIPLISRIARDVMAKHQELQELRDQYRDSLPVDSIPEETEESDDLYQLDEQQMVHMLQIHAFEKEIAEIGGVLRNAVHGEVDFPCVIDGKQGYFCWLPGDEKVAHWHETDGDYTVREPVPVMV